MCDIKYVLYDNKYAASLAEMWNESGDNWGGDEVLRTEETVIIEESNSSNLATFLALEGNKVVGYCGFSNYKGDEGASYIPLLNVHPNYHGKKIGKKLVLKCVDAAIKTDWPRLDLYTWSGNNKAVPLYKKCGFFWEQDENRTHLMNFIPYVMKTEAVKELFNILDWYHDNKREIKVEHDGNEEGDFHFYNYVWENDNKKLLMEFEKSGRGLTCIDCNDYSIKLRIPDHKLIMGKSYKATFSIKNRSPKPLRLQIKSVNDKNISFDFSCNKTINTEETIEAEFLLNSSDEKQNKYKTHPCVKAILVINGQEAEFKIGVMPQKPLEVKLISEAKPTYENLKSDFYLNIENNLNKDVTANAVLKDNELLQFIRPILSFTVKAKGKVSIKVPCVVKKYGFYCEEIKYAISFEDKVINQVDTIKTGIRGHSNMFYGETDESYNLYAGLVKASLKKKENMLILSHLEGHEEEAMWVRCPLVGKPYFDEFTNQKPYNVSFRKMDSSVEMIFSYRSTRYNGLKLHYTVNLNVNGVVKFNCELENTSSECLSNLYVISKCNLWLRDGFIPNDNKVVKMEGYESIYLSAWNSRNITENWIFCGKNLPVGFSWPKSSKVKFSFVETAVEQGTETLQAGSTYKTEDIIYSLKTYSDWKKFRQSLGYNNKIEEIDVLEVFQSNINNGNVFIDDKIDLKSGVFNNTVMKGSVEVTSKYGSILNDRFDLNCENNFSINSIKVDNKRELDIYNFSYSISNKSFSKSSLVFYKSQLPIKVKKYHNGNNDIYEMSNEYLTIKSSPQFFNGVYSLQRNGEEWLNNSYPNPCTKAWWNCWTGGIATKLSGISFATINKEVSNAEFTTVFDDKGNEWSGILTTVKINNHPEYKGIIIKNYFMLMPGCPVLAHFSVIEQNSGTYQQLGVLNCSYIQNTEKQQGNSVTVTDNSKRYTYQYGVSEYDSLMGNIAEFNSDYSNLSLTKVNNLESICEVEGFKDCDTIKSLIEVDLEDKSRFIMPAEYYILSDVSINDKAVNSLQRIRFLIN